MVQFCSSFISLQLRKSSGEMRPELMETSGAARPLLRSDARQPDLQQPQANRCTVCGNGSPELPMNSAASLLPDPPPQKSRRRCLVLNGQSKDPSKLGGLLRRLPLHLGGSLS